MNNNMLKPLDKKLWLSSPTMHGDELKYIEDAYRTNWMSTIGENINQIENSISDFLGTKHAVALSSGTASIHLAMKLAGIKDGDKVFCSDLTFAATVNPVLYENAEPIFIDSEYDTWNMCPIALQKAFELYPDVKVVVLVNLYGTPCKFDEIRSICKHHNALLIEDAAESLGALYKNKQTGSFGDISIISFNGNKIITGSSGGMLLTNNLEQANKVRKWSTQSREDAVWYQHEEIGYNYRISNVIAGVVCGQFPYLDEHIQQKKRIYDRYKVGFKDLPVKMNPFDEKSSIPNYWISCLIINKEAMCKQVRGEIDSCYYSEFGKSCPDEILEILEKHNIEGRPIWKPMHTQPFFSEYKFVNKEFESCLDVGRDIFTRGLCLPSDNKMTVEEQDVVIEIVRHCFNTCNKTIV